MTEQPGVTRKLVIPVDWQVPETFRRRLGDQAGRQRTMFEDDHLLLVLHAPPSPEEVSRTGRLFWRSPSGEWRSTMSSHSINSLRSHVEEYMAAIADCEVKEHHAQTADEYFEMLAELGPIVHAAKNLHIVLREARKLVIDDRELINIRDRSGDMERTGELLYQVGKNGLDFAVAKRAEEQAASSSRMATAAHRLNLLVAFFFPIATLAGIFGMNFQSGLENRWPPFTFAIILLVGLLCGAVLMWFVTGEKK